MNERAPLWNKLIALPQDHGSWVFLFGPMVFGLLFVEKISVAIVSFCVAATMFFLMRQPLSVLVKVIAGRRADKDRDTAILWTVLYGVLGTLGFGYLVLVGQRVVVLLMLVPGVILLGYHLLQIAKHNERKQKTFEMISTGMLSAIAPLILFLDRGQFVIKDLFLWFLLWFQAAASIEYAFSALRQRVWKEVPDSRERIQNGMDALVKTGLNLIFVYMLCDRALIGQFVWVAFLPQFLEVIYSMIKPAINAKPVAIGIRQLALTLGFFLLLAFLW